MRWHKVIVGPYAWCEVLPGEGLALKWRETTCLRCRWRAFKYWLKHPGEGVVNG